MFCADETDQKLYANINPYGTSRNIATHASGGSEIANLLARENIILACELEPHPPDQTPVPLLHVAFRAMRCARSWYVRGLLPPALIHSRRGRHNQPRARGNRPHSERSPHGQAECIPAEAKTKPGRPAVSPATTN